MAWECCWRFGVASAEHAAWLRQGPGAHTGLGPAASANQMRLKFTSRPADDGKVVAAAPVAAAVADGGGCRPPRYNNLRTGVQSALGSFPTSTRQVPGPFGSTTRVQRFDSPPKDAHNTRKTVGRRLGKPRPPQSGSLTHISTPPMRGAFLVGQEGNRASERTWQGTVMSTRRPVESQARRHAPPQFSLHGKGLGGRGVCRAWFRVGQSATCAVVLSSPRRGQKGCV